jgi:hypothetical protein
MKLKLTMLALVVGSLISAPAAVITYEWTSGFNDGGLVLGDGTGWWEIGRASCRERVS